MDLESKAIEGLKPWKTKSTQKFVDRADMDHVYKKRSQKLYIIKNCWFG